MEDVYRICFYGGLVLAILLFLISVVLFVVLKIPKVMGELTGRTARKSINEMKSGVHSSSKVARKEQEKYYNQNSGKIKVRETVSEESRKESGDDTTDLLENEKRGEASGEEETVVLSPENEKETDVLLADEEETDVLAEEEETDVLTEEEETDVLTEEEETDVLATEYDTEETDVLRFHAVEDADETTVLSGGGMTDQLSQRVKVLYNIVITHTDETL